MYVTVTVVSNEITFPAVTSNHTTMSSGLGLGYDGSSSSAEEDMRPRKKKSKKGTAISWLGADEMDEEEQAWFGKKKEVTGIVNKNSSGGISFVKSAAKLLPEGEEKKKESLSPSPSPSPQPESRSSTPEPVVAPKTGKYSVSFVSPKKKSESPPPAQKTARQEAREAQRVTSFLGASTTSKVLKMMKGWKPGQGMGRDGTGIREAIDVKVRPAKVGLGSIDELTEQQKRLDRESKGITRSEPVSLEEELSMFGKKQHGNEPLALRNIDISRKDAKNKKQKKIIPTTDFSFGGADTIVDMSGKPSTTQRDFKRPFLADLRTHIRRSEQEVLRRIQYLDEKLTEECRSKEILESQMGGGCSGDPEATLESLNFIIEKLKKIQLQSKQTSDKVVDDIDVRRKRKKSTVAERTPADIAQMISLHLLDSDDNRLKFNMVHATYKQEINNLLVSIAYPSFDNYFANWNVEESPRRGIQFLKDWVTITSIDGSSDLESIQKLVTTPVGGKLRNYITEWNPQCDIEEHRSRSKLISEWLYYLTNQSKNFLLKQCVVKVAESILTHQLSELSLIMEVWQPTCTMTTSYGRDISLLDDEPIRIAVKNRFISEYSNSSLTLTQKASVIAPWRDMLGGDYPQLFQKMVSKPLLKRLNSCNLNPSKPPPSWLSEIPELCDVDTPLRDAVCTVMNLSLLPRLIYVLASYVRSSSDVRGACLFYRSIRSACPRVLTTGLRISLSLCVKLLLTSQNWWIANTEQREFIKEGNWDYDSVNKTAFEKLATQHKRRTLSHDNVLLSTDVPLREHIVSLAEDANLVFAPKKNMRVDGKQVYALGKLLLYIESNVVHIQNKNGSWEPADSLLGVIDIATVLETNNESNNNTEDSSPMDVDLD